VDHVVNGNFWYVVLFGNDVLTVVLDVEAFLPGQRFHCQTQNGWPYVGCSHPKLLVVGGFLLFAVESMSDNGGCIAGRFDCLGCFGSCDLIGGSSHG
jgi:hypothetical protein